MVILIRANKLQSISLSDVNGSTLVQLNDCTCLGDTQTFECTVFGGAVTIWSGRLLTVHDQEMKFACVTVSIDRKLLESVIKEQL